MPSFSRHSLERLHTCDSRLVQICKTVIRYYDFTVLEGYRSNERQAELLTQGKTKVGPGESKHNSNPSMAVDLAPYPIDWNDPKRFFLLAGMMFAAAEEIDVKLRWGGDWDGDWTHTDQSFHDLPHFEIDDI